MPPLSTDCGIYASSQKRQSAGVIDPELVYLAGGYAGVVSGDVNTLYTALWQGFNNVQVSASLKLKNSALSVLP